MKQNFPDQIPIFPLNGVIYFPKTNLPLNIFEKRYLKLVNDCMKTNKLMGMVQSKKSSNEVYSVGCLGKISHFQDTKDERTPEQIIKEIEDLDKESEEIFKSIKEIISEKN